MAAKVTHFSNALAVGMGRGNSEAIANTGFSLASGALYVHGALGVNGATYFDSTVEVGLDGTGYDVTFYGDTASASSLWDASKDQFGLQGTAKLKHAVHQQLPSNPDRGVIVMYNIGGPGAKNYNLYTYTGAAWEQITHA